MAGLRETSRCSSYGEEHGCNVYSAQWFWVRKHLGGLRASSRRSFAEADQGDLRVTSALQTMMSFDVNTESLECHQRKAYYANREPLAIELVFTLRTTAFHN